MYVYMLKVLTADNKIKNIKSLSLNSKLNIKLLIENEVDSIIRIISYKRERI